MIKINFQGKTVIVTGSTRGIGYAIAQRFAQLGANVMLSGTSDKVYEVRDEFRGNGFSAPGESNDIRAPALHGKLKRVPIL